MPCCGCPTPRLVIAGSRLCLSAAARLHESTAALAPRSATLRLNASSQRAGLWVRNAPAILFSLGITAAVVSWLATTPPGGSPDEPDHYTRAISVGRGEWLGQPVQTVRGLFVSTAEAQSFLHTSRSVDLPPRLATPANWFCLTGDHASSAACIERPTGRGSTLQVTSMGTRQPFAYILPGGVAALFGANPRSALYLGRVAGALLSTVMLLAAIWTVWDGNRTSLIGPALAMSPAVIWISGFLNPSSQEVAAGLLMSAAVVRLGRGVRTIRWSWWVAATAGAVILATARPLGPLWVLLYIGLMLMVVRPAGIRAMVRANPWRAGIASVCVGSAVAAAVAWQMGVPSPGLAPTLNALAHETGPALLSIPETVGEEIGVFGLDDVLMPRWAYGLWGGAVVLVIGVALLRGRKRDFRVVELALVASFVLRWLLDLLIVVSGSPIQGRSLLPMTVVVAMLAGETINRNAGAIRDRGWILVVVGAAVAAVQFTGWYSAAHRFAVGANGSWWILQNTLWEPPGGWVPWIGVMLVACVLVAFGLLPGRPDSR